MGNYVIGAYLAGRCPRYCLKDLELVMYLSQACISDRHASLTDTPFFLKDVCTSLYDPKEGVGL